ncbi:MAG: polysaccharide deacetylase family protein [Saprospiraceae bacterium]
MKIKQAFYPLFNIAASPFSLSFLIKKTEQPLLLPVYHTVSDTFLPHVQHLYPVKNSIQFEKDVDFLLKNFQPISVEEIEAHVKGEKRITKPSFHLSFDDGMRDCIEVIAPILLKKGISATFFINPAFVDNQSLFYRHQISLLIHQIKSNQVAESQIQAVKMLLEEANLYEKNIIQSLYNLKYEDQSLIRLIASCLEINFKDFLKKERPYMTLTEIQELKKDGFHIGGHSVNHPKYQEIDLNEQLSQTRGSLEFVQKNVPSQSRSFAFPYSSDGISRAFFDTLATEMDVSYGTSSLKLDTISTHLHRFPMEGTPFSPKTMIKGEYFFFLLQTLLGKNTVKR